MAVGTSTTGVSVQTPVARTQATTGVVTGQTTTSTTGTTNPQDTFVASNQTPVLTAQQKNNLEMDKLRNQTNELMTKLDTKATEKYGPDRTKWPGFEEGEKSAQSRLDAKLWKYSDGRAADEGFQKDYNSPAGSPGKIEADKLVQDWKNAASYSKLGAELGVAGDPTSKKDGRGVAMGLANMHFRGSTVFHENAQERSDTQFGAGLKNPTAAKGLAAQALPVGGGDSELEATRRQVAAEMAEAAKRGPTEGRSMPPQFGLTSEQQRARNSGGQ